MKKKKYKRRLFVSKKLQALFALYMLISFSLATLFLTYEFLKVYITFWGFSIPAINSFIIFLKNPLCIRITILLVWATVWYGLSIILTTNRFAGPLIRLNHVLNDIKSGKYNKFRFRKGDYHYRETEDNINELIEILSQKKDEKDKLLTEAEDNLFILGKLLRTKNLPEETIDLLSKIKQKIEECKKT